MILLVVAALVRECAEAVLSDRALHLPTLNHCCLGQVLTLNVQTKRRDEVEVGQPRAHIGEGVFKANAEREERKTAKGQSLLPSSDRGYEESSSVMQQSRSQHAGRASKVER